MNLDFTNKSQTSSETDTVASKPKLFKKGMMTAKATENKQAPAAASVGYNFTTEGQSSNNIEENVAKLSLQMNQVIVRPYLQQALDYLKNSKHDSINAYNQLSDQIANEIRIISQNTQQISVSLKEAQDVVAKTQEIIRNKYNNAVEEEISSGALNLDYEYNIVAEHYELSLQLTQELSKYKARIDSLLSTQSMLDESIVPSVSRLQLEIDNLELLIHSFDSSDYADILAKKTGTSISRKQSETNEFKTRSDELNKIVAASSVNSVNEFEQRNVNLQEMNRREAPTQQRIVTNNYEYKAPQQEPVNNFQQQVRNNPVEQNYNQQQPMMGQEQQPQQGMFNNQYNQTNYQMDGYNGPAPMSKQEAKMMQKLRQQQMKFETMMRMNEMIFEYNKQIDQMMLRQQEYELAHREQYAAANARMNSLEGQANSGAHVYESQMPIETVSDNVKKSKNDKLFVVRQAEPISEEKANELKHRGSVKSIRVLK